MKDAKDKGRRVVVTGLGVVSSIGIGWPEFWENLLAGKSGISEVTAFDTSGHQRKYGGHIKGFCPEQFFSKKASETMGRASQLAVAASKMALEDAGIDAKDLTETRMGIFLGTTVGEGGLLEQLDESYFIKKKKVLNKTNALLFPSCLLGINVLEVLALSGQIEVFANACASGNYAIGRGFDLIRSGTRDMALVGGADGFSRVVFSGFDRLYAIALQRCQPFDKNRQGMIPAEGAGMLILEDMDRAEARGAHIYAEVLGYGLSCDARHMTHPSVEGIAKAIQKACRESHIDLTEVDYICAHGTGTKENDLAECSAIHQVFGARTPHVPVSSIKSMLGHTMGAAAALETISCCLAIQENKIPPTINLEEQDPECRIDCVPNVARDREVKIALNNASAFGGNNACVALGAV